jgi:hypothetical protein
MKYPEASNVMKGSREEIPVVEHAQKGRLFHGTNTSGGLTSKAT